MIQRSKPQPEGGRFPPAPIDLVDGIPDRSPQGGKWKLLAMLVVFLGWLALLVYLKLAGKPQ